MPPGPGSPVLPAAQSGGRPRTTDLRAVLNAIFYLLRTGCQWRLLPREFRARAPFPLLSCLEDAGVLTELQRALHQRARLSRGRLLCPSVVILDSHSVKTTERGGTRGFDGHKRVKGRKRHLLVDTLGMVVARRVEPPMSRTDAWGRCCCRLAIRLPAHGRNRRLSKDYELKVQTSEAFIDLAAIRLMLKRLALGKTSQTPSQSEKRIVYV